MTPMFDEMDKVLREALASEALPSDGFTDRVMARVAETPQQRKAPPAARKWLVTAAACLVVAAALIPLLHSGGLHKGSNMQAVFSDSAVPGSDTAPAAANENSAERLALIMRWMGLRRLTARHSRSPMRARTLPAGVPMERTCTRPRPHRPWTRRWRAPPRRWLSRALS